MRRRFHVMVFLLLLAALQACTTSSPIPDLPATLGGKGLLVARLYVPGSSAWNNARINIDGKLYGSNLRDGYVAIALDPGEHNFVQLRVEGQRLSNYEPQDPALRKVRGGGAPTYYYVPGGTTTIYYTTLSVGRRFTIEADQITNLGLIVYLSADDPTKQRATTGDSKEYRVVPLDNSAEISYYLETNYPALMATLKERSPKLAPGSYLDSKRLPELRRFIAIQESRGAKFIKNETASALYGDAGTLAVSRTGADGKRTVEVLDTGTLANIVDARRDGERMIFLTSDAKLLTLENGRLAQTSVPYRIHPVRLSSLGNDSVAIVDNRMSILISQDRGKTWSKYDGAMIEKPRNDIGLVADGQGAYVYLGNRGIPSSILYLRSGAATPQVINTPQYRQSVNTTSYNTVIAREAGLFIIYNERDFYFWSRKSHRWELHSKPAFKCKAIGFDASGFDLTVECDGTTYESGNSGLTWSKAGGV